MDLKSKRLHIYNITPKTYNSNEKQIKHTGPCNKHNVRQQLTDNHQSSLRGEKKKKKDVSGHKYVSRKLVIKEIKRDKRVQRSEKSD